MLERRVLILASGGGSNAEAIVQRFKLKKLPVTFSAACNVREAGVFNKMKQVGVRCTYVPSPKQDFSKLEEFLEASGKFDAVVLAGYMRVLPLSVLEKQKTVINIHPSILPFVYKGSMDAYSEAINNCDTVCGCTVHYVTPEVDSGERIAQIAFEVPEDIIKQHDVERLKQIGLAYEHALFPSVLESLLHLRNEDSQMIDLMDVATVATENLLNRSLPTVKTILPKDGVVFTKFSRETKIIVE